MATRTQLSELLGISYPIIQAPMAGSNSPELVAAVSNAGGLGMYGAAYLAPAQIEEVVAAIRTLTDRPFGINLFAGVQDASSIGEVDRLMSILGQFHAELGLPPPLPPSSKPDPFANQLQAVLDLEVPIFSFTFGMPEPVALAELEHRGTIVMGTATTVEEARQLDTAGIHAVVAQGSEAGGHRGTFAEDFDAAMVGTVALVPQVVDAIGIPVIASGGIMDGRGIVAAEALGASGVQLGTAFLTCPETTIPDSYRRAIRAAQAEHTRITRAFSGRPARGVVNHFMRGWQGHEDAILSFPVQNDATRPLRTAAAAADDARFLSLWAGQGAALARELPAADVFRQLVQEADAVRERLRLNTMESDR